VGYAALAASLLGFGVLIGLWSGGGPRHNEILAAQASIEPLTARGNPADRDLRQLRVTAPFDGFLTAVALFPDRKQHVLPEEVQDEVRVRADVPSTPIELPQGATRVVFVVSETRAREAIRKQFEDRRSPTYLDRQEADLRRSLGEFLLGEGYRRLAVGSVEVKRVDSP